MTEPGSQATCAVHPDQTSVGICARCGRFVCDVCRGELCPECRQHVDRRAKAPPDWLTSAVFNLLVLQTVSTVTLVLGSSGWTSWLVWAVLSVAFLLWYGAVVRWANGLALTTEPPARAMVAWLIPGVNFVHPFRTLRHVCNGIGARVPLWPWWISFWVSSVFLAAWVAGIRALPLTLAATASHLVASVLALVVVRRLWLAIAATHARRTAPDPPSQCSFCGKAQAQVQKLIAGPAVGICDGCVPTCRQAPPVERHRRVCCSFCGKRGDAVARSVAGRSNYICDPCLELCVDILAEDAREEPKGMKPGAP